MFSAAQLEVSSIPGQLRTRLRLCVAEVRERIEAGPRGEGDQVPAELQLPILGPQRDPVAICTGIGLALMQLIITRFLVVIFEYNFVFQYQYTGILTTFAATHFNAGTINLWL